MAVGAMFEFNSCVLYGSLRVGRVCSLASNTLDVANKS